jgi:hypothetical protein
MQPTKANVHASTNSMSLTGVRRQQRLILSSMQSTLDQPQVASSWFKTIPTTTLEVAQVMVKSWTPLTQAPAPLYPKALSSNKPLRQLSALKPRQRVTSSSLQPTPQQSPRRLTLSSQVWSPNLLWNCQAHRQRFPWTNLYLQIEAI